MTALLQRVPHVRGEAATSYASRLAACNGADLATFLRHMGIRLMDLIAGKRGTLEVLASLGGADVEALARDAIVREDERRWSLRGQWLSTGTLRRLRPRFCPSCALDDLGTAGLPRREAAHGRSVWSVEPLRTCAVHHVALLDPLPVRKGRDAPGDRLAHDFVTAFAPATRTLNALRGRLTRRPPSAMEEYLLRRLEGGSGGSAWLDTLDFDVAAFLMEKVGAVAAFGRGVRYDGMSDEDLWFAGDVSHGLLEGGVGGLLRFCDMLQATYQGTGSGKEGPNSTYGRWWWSLNFEYRGPQFEPVMAPLREHVLATVPIEPGARVLGHVVERRRMYSIRSASREYGCRPARLRRMLTAAGVLAPDQQRRRNALAAFDVDRAAPILAMIGDRVRGTEARALLGVSDLRPFMREELFVPLTGYVDRKQRLYEFSRVELERFLQEMTRRATEVDEAGPGQVGLYEAVTVLRRSVGEIAKVIHDGRATKTRRLRGGRGLRDLLVDVGEMRLLLHGRSYDGLPVSDLHLRLRTSSDVVVRLIERGAIVAETVLSDITRRPHRMVTSERLAEYEATYVLLYTLARERGCDPKLLRSDLRRRGVEPAFPPDEIGASVYLRSEVG